jgi:hypothetical protein
MKILRASHANSPDFPHFSPDSISKSDGNSTSAGDASLGGARTAGRAARVNKTSDKRAHGASIHTWSADIPVRQSTC